MTLPIKTGDASLPNVIRLAVSTAFHNKDIRPNFDKQAYGNSFVSQDISPTDLVQHIATGNAFTMGAFSEGRKKAAFTSGQVFGLDLDNNISVADCLAHEFIAQYAYLVYATPSSGNLNEQGEPVYKSRVLFIADEPVTDRLVWERYERAILFHCSTLEPDSACKDAARLFFGSATDEYHTQDAILPLSVLDTLADAMEAELGALEPERTAEQNDTIRTRNKTLITDKKQSRYYNYASAALDNHVSTMQSAPQGERNDTLNKVGFAMGGMVGAGMISYSEVETAIRSAARSAGLSDHEISGTLSRSINDGMSNPTDLHALDIQWQAKTAEWQAQRQNKTIDINAVYQQQKAELPDTKPITVDDKMAEYYASEAGILEQVAHNHKLYLDGQYRSWWDGSIPMSFVSAMLNLTDTRSGTMLVLGKIHDAMLRGKLSWAVFSIPDICDATGLSRVIVKKALPELEKGGYVQFLKGESLYNILSSIHPSLESASTLNQTPADHYTVLFNLDEIRYRLLKQLKVFFTEKHASRGLAKPTLTMAEQIGITDYETFKKWEALYDAASADKLTQDARYNLDKELFGAGDNSAWKGWKYALSHDFAIDIDWVSCETIKDVRGQLLRGWVQFRDINTQEELTRIVGCSEATLSSLYDVYNIGSEQRTEKVEMDANFNNLYDVFRDVQRDLRGQIFIVKFKYEGEQGWHAATPQFAPLSYARNRAKITKVLMIVNIPSRQWVLNADEKAQVQTLRDAVEQVGTIEDEKLHKQVNHAIRAADVDSIPKLLAKLTKLAPAIEAEAPTAKAPRKAPTQPVITPSHDWTHHRAAWIHRKIAEAVFMFTEYELVGDCIFDTDKQLIFKADGYNLGSLVNWLVNNRSETQLRQSTDFHGIEVEDYTEEVLAILKAQYEAELKQVYTDSVPDFDMPDEKVVQMPLEPTQDTDKKELTEREKAMIEFCRNRQEREQKEYVNRFAGWSGAEKYRTQESDKTA